jgi:hypothetical protein
MQFLSYATITLPKWLETLNKLTLTLEESKTMPFDQRKRKGNKNRKYTYVAMANFANL